MDKKTKILSKLEDLKFEATYCYRLTFRDQPENSEDRITKEKFRMGLIEEIDAIISLIKDGE